MCSPFFDWKRAQESNLGCWLMRPARPPGLATRNILFYKKFYRNLWSHREVMIPQPIAYKAIALPIELRWQ